MIELADYTPTDPFFGAPYIDSDDERTEPVPHRHIHGGFEGTDTRFRMYFPPAGSGYEGRMFNPLSGAHGGTEDFFSSMFGEIMGGLTMCLRLGGYMIESNQGHIGDDIDERGGDDPTLYGHRASAEVARFSKYVAAQIYGEAPHHSYVYGGSGGGRRSPLCLENAQDSWDGAVPFMGGGDVAPLGSTKRIKGAQVMSFASMFNVQRLFGEQIYDVIDAMSAGGSGDPFAGLDTHRREELASLYRQGYPRGDEFMIAEPMGQIWLWTSIADALYEQDPSYFENFWTAPGYIGHDQPEHVADDLIDATVTVKRVLRAADLVNDPEFAGPEFRRLRSMVGMMAGTGRDDLPFAVQLDGVPDGYRMGMGVLVKSGKAAGRQLYCSTTAGDVFFCDGRGDSNLLRFTDVEPGDEVHVDNRRFLAFCYFSRHHLMDDAQFDSLRLDGQPIFQQHPIPEMSPLMGVSYSGDYTGKLIWVHHTHDASLWPPQGVIYADAVVAAQGPELANERFRIRWSENAEHVPPIILPPNGNRAANTWLIDYQPIIEQSLVDLVDWVENGVEPVGTEYSYHDGMVTLPASAADRGGIQAVVSVAANGTSRADVAVGEAVTFTLEAELPPGAGTFVGAAWDFDGSGTYASQEAGIDGTQTVLKASTTHAFDAPGTYFVTGIVHSHRDGDVAATSRRIPNLAQARVVVA